jgi:hypothetical protein
MDSVFTSSNLQPQPPKLQSSSANSSEIGWLAKEVSSSSAPMTTHVSPTSSASTSSFTTATTFSAWSSLSLPTGVRSPSSAQNDDPTPPPWCSTSSTAMVRHISDNRDSAFVSEHRRDSVPNRELRPEFNALHYGSASGEDEDGSAAVTEMVGRALTVWREAHAVGRNEMHGNRRQPKLHLLPPHIFLHGLYGCSVEKGCMLLQRCSGLHFAYAY